MFGCYEQQVGNSLPCQRNIAVGQMSYSADMVDAIDMLADLRAFRKRRKIDMGQPWR